MDGFPQERWRRYEREKARGGCGVVMMFGLGWVRVANTLTGQERRIEADTVVVALPGRSDDRLAHALEGRGPAVHVVGDALAPRTIHDALLTATREARAI